MNRTIRITAVCMTPASDVDVQTGLLAYLTATINHTIKVDGLALRRTMGGRIIVTFPSRRDSAGRHHAIVQPLDHATRLDLEQQILSHLDLEALR